MQKIITISTLAAILSLPAFAEIANNATCNNTNLGQSDNNSTANVEANWNANTININWYNGDTKITSNTCTYDGTITLPAQPTKPGYIFAGWRLKGSQQTPTSANCDAINSESACESNSSCMWDEDEGWCSPRPTITLEDCDNDPETCSQCMKLFPEENFVGWAHNEAKGDHCCHSGTGCVG